MAITITRDLNVVSVGVPPVIHLSQYDSDFTLVFNLYASTGTFTMPSGTTAEIRGTKRDGNGYDAAATVSGNTVTVTGDEQMTAVAGQNFFEIATYYNNKRLNTINFILDVERAALDADTIISESVLRELNAIIEGAATATQAAEDAEDAANRAEEAADDLSGTVQQVATNTQDIADLKGDLEQIEPGLSDDAKVALLACFQVVAWADPHGQTYYDALESALYAGRYPKITALFNSGSNTIYTDDTLDSLKQYLVVTYFETESSTGVVLPSTDYSLTGTLTEGTSKIFVTYNSLTTSFVISGVVDYYNIYEWEWTQNSGNLTKVNGGAAYSNGNATINITNQTMVNARRAFCANKGKKPYVNLVTSVPLNVYPIPIPPNATKVTLSISPSERQVFGYLLTYDSLNDSYYCSDQAGVDVIGFTNGSSSITFSAGAYQFLVAATRHSASGTYTEEPNSYSVLFEEV